MDLSKAFDSVSHSKLINKLYMMGIIGPTLTWLRSYLEDKNQFVELLNINYNNQLIATKSKLNSSKHDAPQGSSFGPLLFICYIRGSRIKNVIVIKHMAKAKVKK